MTHQVLTVILACGSDGPDPDLTWVYVQDGDRNKRTEGAIVETSDPMTYEAAGQHRDETVTRLRSQGHEVHEVVMALD